MRESDTVLWSYLHSTDDAERGRLRDELLQTFAAPVIRRALRDRLGFRAGANGRDSNPAEAADLFQDAMLALVAKLNQADAHNNGIRDFDKYVRGIAANACRDFLRRKAPIRSTQNHNLRDLLTRHRDFAIWPDGSGGHLCGFAVWKDRAADSVSSAQRDKIIRALRQSGIARPDRQRLPLSRILSEIFNQFGHPIELETLAEICSELRAMPDMQLESLDQQAEESGFDVADPTPPADSRIEIKERLQEVWEELRRMPPNHRLCLCLIFSDPDGETVLHHLLNARLVPLGELTSTLGLTREQLMELWKEMPMEIASTAKYLGAPRPQVGQWYHRALKRLLAHLTRI
jgi:RNA polymerase sigma factor (sigma-70 family)